MTPRGSGLRARERTTIRLLARGAGTAEIARQLGVKPTTVRSIIRGIGTRWGTSSRDKIITVALRLGVVPSSEPKQ